MKLARNIRLQLVPEKALAWGDILQSNGDFPANTGGGRQKHIVPCEP